MKKILIYFLLVLGFSTSLRSQDQSNAKVDIYAEVHRENISKEDLLRCIGIIVNGKDDYELLTYCFNRLVKDDYVNNLTKNDIDFFEALMLPVLHGEGYDSIRINALAGWSSILSRYPNEKNTSYLIEMTSDTNEYVVHNSIVSLIGAKKPIVISIIDRELGRYNEGKGRGDYSKKTWEELKVKANVALSKSSNTSVAVDAKNATWKYAAILMFFIFLFAVIFFRKSSRLI